MLERTTSCDPQEVLDFGKSDIDQCGDDTLNRRTRARTMKEQCLLCWPSILYTSRWWLTMSGLTKSEEEALDHCW